MGRLINSGARRMRWAAGFAVLIGGLVLGDAAVQGANVVSKQVEGLPYCGVLRVQSHAVRPGRYRVGANVACKGAVRTLSRYFRGEGIQHTGPTFSDFYTQVGPWRCGYSTGTAGCTRSPHKRLVAVTATLRLRCTPPRGPGDNQFHSANLRVENTSCAVGRRVALACTRYTYGTSGTCLVAGASWYCSSRQSGGLGSSQRCSSGIRRMSIYWTD
jgi:hypothetical protein